MTVDPERDTPEVLRAVRAGVRSALPRAVRRRRRRPPQAAKEFKVYFQKQPAAPAAATRSTTPRGTYVFDPQGRLRLFVQLRRTARRRSLHDIRLLLSSDRSWRIKENAAASRRLVSYVAVTRQGRAVRRGAVQRRAIAPFIFAAPWLSIWRMRSAETPNSSARSCSVAVSPSSQPARFDDAAAARVEARPAPARGPAAAALGLLAARAARRLGVRRGEVGDRREGCPRRPRRAARARRPGRRRRVSISTTSSGFTLELAARCASTSVGRHACRGPASCCAG